MWLVPGGDLSPINIPNTGSLPILQASVRSRIVKESFSSILAAHLRRQVRAVLNHQPTTARGGQAGIIRLPGLHALLHDPREDAFALVASRSRNGSTGPWRASTRYSASADIATSGRSASGLGGAVNAGSPTSPSEGQAGTSVRSAAGCNACGCGRCAGDPSERVSTGRAWSA